MRRGHGWIAGAGLASLAVVGALAGELVPTVLAGGASSRSPAAGGSSDLGRGRGAARPEGDAPAGSSASSRPVDPGSTRTAQEADEDARSPARPAGLLEGPRLERTSDAPQRSRPRRLDAVQVAQALEGLRDDDVVWNACGALMHLERAGPEVIPALQEALYSEDWQQRQMAAYLLVDRNDAAPSRALANALVEALRDDDLPYAEAASSDERHPDGTFTLVFNHDRARWRMIRDPELLRLAEPALLRALDSTDAQQRSTAAYLLARGGARGNLARTCAVLIDHLRDNDLAGDASSSLAGLAWLGADARAYVEAALPGQDEQQRALLAHWLGHFVPWHPAARRLGKEEIYALQFRRGDPCLRPDR